MTKTEISLALTLDELLIISNSLNEVCNGLPLDDFENRVGMPHSQALILLEKICDMYRENNNKGQPTIN